MFRKPCVLAGCVLTLCICSSVADAAPTLGDYWYDWIGNTPTGTNPHTEVGEVVLDADSMSATYTSSLFGSDSFGFSYTGTSYDANGYLLFHTANGDLKLAANSNAMIGVSEEPDDDNILSSAVMIRKRTGFTEADLAGGYKYFGQGFDVPADNAGASYGDVTLVANPPNSWTATGTDVWGMSTTTFNESGTWTSDSGAGTCTFTFDSSEPDATWHVGQGGILMHTWIDDETSGDVLRDVLVKTSSGKTLADAAGSYLLQGFLSAPDASEILANHGTLDIAADGSFTSVITQMGVTDTDTGTIAISDDGTFLCTFSGGETMNGILNEDGTVGVIETTDHPSGALGYTFAVRVPEPATLGLFALGGIVLLRRKAKNKTF